MDIGFKGVESRSRLGKSPIGHEGNPCAFCGWELPFKRLRSQLRCGEGIHSRCE